MVKYPSGDSSYWITSSPDSHYPQLLEDMETDVVIVGAGIAGLTTAYLLKQAGLRVIILEKGKLGTAVSGHTTGKVTSQHNIIYKKLRDRFGLKTAQIYGGANEKAINFIEAIINKHQIACDWAVDDNYVYTEKAEEVKMLKDEALAAMAAGLPASFETSTPLPFDVKGAVKFSNQAKLHIRKYLSGLADAVKGDSCYIFEESPARWVRGSEPCIIRTPQARVKATDVVIATNVPFPLTSHGFYCLYEYPLKSYIVAAKTKVKLRGMYITPGDPLFSILPIKSGDDSLILIGGNSHVPGVPGKADSRYRQLADYGAERFGISKYEYRWSTMDYLAYDSIPMVGKLYPWSKHVYTATGFMKWGLSNATVAALILKDLIIGQDNPWAGTFSTNRLSAVKAIPAVAAKYVGFSK